jgi:hypothetical protein
MDLKTLSKALECHKCGRWVENISEEAVKVTCSYCVLTAVGYIDSTVNEYKPTGRPVGWHWMKEFVDKDGTVFHKGKEQPELKGTLKPTKVKPPKEKIKRRTKEQMLIDRHNEKKAALKKAVKKQQDFLNHKINKG